MTDTPIRTFSTIVGDSDARSRDLAAFLPADWEPDTPVLVIAGLPRGATIMRRCDVPAGWEMQDIYGVWVTPNPSRSPGLVVCRPKPVPAPPATPDLTPLFDALDAHDRVQARFGTGAGASFKVLAAVRALRDGGTR